MCSSIYSFIHAPHFICIYLTADDRGTVEVRVRARGLYLVTTCVNNVWLYGFISTERGELSVNDRVHRSLLAPAAVSARD